MEEAREAFQRLAEAIASVLAFTMNAAIEPLTPTVIFDATPSRKRHEYWQFVQPPFAGLPRHSRVLDDKGFEAVVAALVVNTHTDAIQRAIGHFRRAVSHTLPGEWLLAVAHGWMGFEALKPVALKQELERLGWTKAQLAAAWGVTTSVLENEARLRLLFPGRSGLHHRSRNTSNNLEHSLTELGPLHKQAEKDAMALVTQLRRAILRCLFERVPRSLSRSELSRPHPSAPLQRFMRAVLIGSVDDLAPPDLQYPHFDLVWEPTEVELTPTGAYTANHNMTGTVRLGSGARVTQISTEIWGPPNAK
jgi:hypothetical protein